MYPTNFMRFFLLYKRNDDFNVTIGSPYLYEHLLLKV